MRSILGELWAFLRARRKVWMFPVIVWMAILIGLVIVAQGTALGPYLYSFF